MNRALGVFVATLLGVGCTGRGREPASATLPVGKTEPGSTAASTEPVSAALAPDSTTASAKPTAEESELDAIASELWEAGLKRSPLHATFLGERKYDGELPDLTEQARDAWYGSMESLLARVESIPFEKLRGQRRITAPVLGAMLKNKLARRTCRYELWDVDHLDGYQSNLAEIGTYQIVDSPVAAQAYLKRIHGVALLFEQQIENLRAGIAQGYSAPRVTVLRVLAQLDKMLAVPLAETPYVAVLGRASGLAGEQPTTFRRQILEQVRTGIRPALKRYRSFLVEQYLPAARRDVGLWSNQNGPACYEAAVRRHVGESLDPAQIHRTGLEELTRLQIEMLEIARAAGHATVAAYARALRDSPKQQLRSREDLIAHNTRLVARAQAALPKAFGRLPKVGVGVKAIEGFREAESPAAYYYSAAPDGSRPAYYYVNTYKPATRPLYNMEALAFHEAVPGHHLQIGIAQSLEELPKVRRHGGFSAFVEGWALYAELLADELGLYSSESTRFGMLNYQAWRAARLVVDTGLHAQGWDRDRAIALMKKYLAFPEHEIVNEVDRYIIWPGQALAYMLGRMRIQALRKTAEERLGDRFDLRAFHDRLLENGALPLSVLEENTVQWIDSVAGPVQ